MPEQFLAQTQQQRLQMTLAPQMRQSLEVLQVPLMELRTLVQEELQQNPTLEEQPLETAQIEIEPGTGTPEPATEPQSEDEKVLDFKKEFDVLARLDDEWREYFHQSQGGSGWSEEAAAKRQFFFDSLEQPESLLEHLRSQLNLSAWTEAQKKVGELIIGSLNEDGYLTVGLEELALNTGMPLAELQAVLPLIQEFDPIGVGARDLAECLLLQLRRLGKENSLAAALVRGGHLEALGAKKYPLIARALQAGPEEVQQAGRFIATLEPKPGRMFSAEEPAYVLPEVQVQKRQGEYVIVLNRDQVPHLLISKHYRQLMEDPATTTEVRSYIREKIRASAFLIKSIQQRQQTIHRIATEIVQVQREFFEHGLSHLRPLVMADIARILGIHETTVSRAIANKYMQTPRGTFEMKYFFTPGYRAADGQQVSNKSIMDLLAQLVGEEDPAAPLSDQAIVARLQEKGLTVARRTIAKYRDELHIPPSHLRKAT